MKERRKGCLQGTHHCLRSSRIPLYGCFAHCSVTRRRSLVSSEDVLHSEVHIEASCMTCFPSSIIRDAPSGCKRDCEKKKRRIQVEEGVSRSSCTAAVTGGHMSEAQSCVLEKGYSQEDI